MEVDEILEIAGEDWVCLDEDDACIPCHERNVACMIKLDKRAQFYEYFSACAQTQWHYNEPFPVRYSGTECGPCTSKGLECGPPQIFVSYRDEYWRGIDSERPYDSILPLDPLNDTLQNGSDEPYTVNDYIDTVRRRLARLFVNTVIHYDTVLGHWDKRVFDKWTETEDMVNDRAYPTEMVHLSEE